jgi:polysaccharide biosynthesis/export protein
MFTLSGNRARHIGNALTFLALLSPMLMATPPTSVVDTKPATPEYRVHPGDVLRVDYRYTPEYNSTVEVPPDGIGTLPFIGAVKLTGMTVAEVQSEILAKANERLKDPEVTVALVGFEQPSYVVGGEVGSPGKYPVHGRITALQAVEIAGGFRDSGKASQILLIRPVDNARGQTTLIDLKKVLSGKELAEDIELKPGDMLVVPKTRLAKVTPYVRLMSPGTYGIYINPANY